MRAGGPYRAGPPGVPGRREVVDPGPPPPRVLVRVRAPARHPFDERFRCAGCDNPPGRHRARRRRGAGYFSRAAHLTVAGTGGVAMKAEMVAGIVLAAVGCALLSFGTV